MNPRDTRRKAMRDYVAREFRAVVLAAFEEAQETQYQGTAYAGLVDYPDGCEDLDEWIEYLHEVKNAARSYDDVSVEISDGIQICATCDYADLEREAELRMYDRQDDAAKERTLEI